MVDVAEAAATHRPLRYGLPASRSVTVADRVIKRGPSGPLEFLTVQHGVAQNGEVCVTEEQDINAHSSFGARGGGRRPRPAAWRRC